MSAPVLHLNLSGADWRQIHPLVDAGRMPIMAQLIEAGCIGNLYAPAPLARPIPALSLATGHFADQHGVLGDLIWHEDDGARMLTPNDLRHAPLWDLVAAQGKRAIAIGWPGTTPAPRSDALVISDGFTAPLGTDFDSWPVDPTTLSDPTLAETLAEARLHPSEVTAEMVGPFVPQLKDVDQDTDPRISQFLRLFARAISTHGAATWAAEAREWDYLGVHLDLIEQASATFLQYQAPRMGHVTETDFALFEGVVAGFYQFFDFMLERYLQLLPDTAHLLITSDHGFESGAARPKPVQQAGQKIAQQYRDLGIFALQGPQARPDHVVFGTTVFDIVPTALALLDLAPPKDLPGQRAVDALISKPPQRAAIDPPAPSASDQDWSDPVQHAQFADLRDFGYLPARMGQGDAMNTAIRVSTLLTEAVARTTRGALPQAIESLETLATLAPDHGPALRLRLRIALQQKDSDTAPALLAELEAVDPFDTSLAMMAAEVALLTGDREAARTHMARFSEDIPIGRAGAGPLTRLAELHHKLGELDQAEARFRSALRRDSDAIPALTGLGRVLFAQNRPSEAIALLQKSTGRRFIQLEAQMILAQCHAALGQFAQAERAALTATQIAPQYPAAQTLLRQVKEAQAKGIVAAQQAPAP